MRIILAIIFCCSIGLAETFNQSVGVVGDTVLTQRQAIGSKLLDLYYAGKKAEDKFTDADVSAALVEKVVGMEAGAFELSDSMRAQVVKDLPRAFEFVQNSSLGKKMKFEKSEVEKMMLDKALYKDFIEFKTLSLKSTVTDAEAKVYFDKNKAKFGNVQFDSYRSQVVAFLEQQQLQDRMKSWFEVLRRKYSVRNLLAK